MSSHQYDSSFSEMFRERMTFISIANEQVGRTFSVVSKVKRDRHALEKAAHVRDHSHRHGGYGGKGQNPGSVAMYDRLHLGAFAIDLCMNESFEEQLGILFANSDTV